MLVLRSFYAPVQQTKDGELVTCDNPNVVRDEKGQEYFGYGCVYNISSFEQDEENYFDVSLRFDHRGHEELSTVSKENVFIGDCFEVGERYNEEINGLRADDGTRSSGR